MTDIIERAEAALVALLNYQQADTDGVMVLVSRQAIHEVEAHARAQEAEIARLRDALGLAEGQVKALETSRNEFRGLFLSACAPLAASPDIADVVVAVETWVNQRGGDDTADQIAIMAIQAYQRANNDICANLRDAAQALGAMPEGYCFCSANRIGDDSKAHEPECAELRAALNGG
jgi:hypothetical protein